MMSFSDFSFHKIDDDYAKDDVAAYDIISYITPMPMKHFRLKLFSFFSISFIYEAMPSALWCWWWWRHYADVEPFQPLLMCRFIFFDYFWFFGWFLITPMCADYFDAIDVRFIDRCRLRRWLSGNISRLLQLFSWFLRLSWCGPITSSSCFDIFLEIDDYADT